MCGSERPRCPMACSAWPQPCGKGHPHGPCMLDKPPAPRREAADALGIAVGQIAKSIIFRPQERRRGVLVVTSGDRRVDEKKVEAHVGARSAVPMPIL